jgi:beta-mannosidase
LKNYSLNGEWQLSYGPQDNRSPRIPTEFRAANLAQIPARVPGNVEIDLENAGKINDPTVGNHIYALREFETFQWWYQKKFSTPEFQSTELVELVFEGLDCFAEIWLNDILVGTAKNMFIPHRFEVTHALKFTGENELLVCLSSALLEGRKHRHSALEQALPGKWEALAVRKAAHGYGWDIMPRAVSAGIWRDVYLDVRPPTRFTSIYWGTLRTNPENRTANIFVTWQFETRRMQPDDLILKIGISQNSQVKYQTEIPVFSTAGREFIELQSVALWWPRGYGEPARCEASLSLLDADGSVLDQTRHLIGLRQLELRRTEIASPNEPGEFVFIMNGVKIFAKGTNWVPLDALHSRDSRHLPAALEMLVDLNCNMVRCWGGNVYPKAKKFCWQWIFPCPRMRRN